MQNLPCKFLKSILHFIATKKLKVFCLEAMLLWFVPFPYHFMSDSILHSTSQKVRNVCINQSRPWSKYCFPYWYMQNQSHLPRVLLLTCWQNGLVVMTVSTKIRVMTHVELLKIIEVLTLACLTVYIIMWGGKIHIWIEVYCHNHFILSDVPQTTFFFI